MQATLRRATRARDASPCGALGLLCAAAVAAAGALPAQEPRGGEPTIFRQVGIGTRFPNLDLLDDEGAVEAFTPAAGVRYLIAFLRRDQLDSTRLYADLEALALDNEIADLQVLVVGMRSGERTGWPRPKALPRRLTIRADAGDLGEQLGLIALPSLALLDSDRLLVGAYVLHDSQLLERLRLDLGAVGGAEATAEARARRQFEDLERTAAALEAAGELTQALDWRHRQVQTGLDPAASHLALGRLELRMGRADAAVVHLRTSLEAQATVAAKAWLGRALLRAGELAEARETLQAVLPEATDPALVRRDLAEIAHREGDTQAALEHIKAAIEAARSVER